MGVEDKYKEMIREFENRNKNPLATRLIDDVNKNRGLFKTVLNLSEHQKFEMENNLVKSFEKEVNLSRIRYEESLKTDQINFSEFIIRYREEIR